MLRVNFPGTAFVAGGLCLLLLFVGSRFIERVGSQPSPEPRRRLTRDYSGDVATVLPAASPASDNVERVLERTRRSIRRELANVTWAGVPVVRRLGDLIPELGGNPSRNVIVSSWRSGTTFLGALLNSIPGTFYHFEPLCSSGTVQIRGSPSADAAKGLLRKIFACNHSELYRPQYRGLLPEFYYNTRLWNVCKYEQPLCLESEFTSRFCGLFPFQIMKLVRLRLGPMEELMADLELNISVVLMVRDPRGMMQSRAHVGFCPPSPDCWEPARVCADMVDDYMAASRLINLYPDRFMVIRYEDLALNLRATTHELLSFMRLGGRNVDVDTFLKRHTSTYVGGRGSTFRNTHDMPFRWTKLLSFDYVLGVQEECKEAMSLWGYRPAHNASHLISQEFVPLERYTLNRADASDSW